MTTLTAALVRARIAATQLPGAGRADRERGDVPGWVLITLMTAALVAALWTVAEGQLTGLFRRAMDTVTR